MKIDKKTLIITLILTLMPCFIGLLLWNQLPDTIPTHFNYNNEIDGYSSKPFVVFAIPALLVILHFLCVFMSLHDPRKQNISPKLKHFVLYIIPSVSLLICVLSYGTALGYMINPGMVVNLLLGFLFIVIGNYLPKIKQNYTMGIKLPWTLASETNWYKTHRMAGWLWILSGILFLGNAFLRSPLLMIAAVILMIGIPGIYSYFLYKKESAGML